MAYRGWVSGLSIVAAAPMMIVPKCIEYDPAFHVARGSDARTDGDGSDFGPAVPCSAPGHAELTVENHEFRIQCGCAELEGKTCTIRAGTTVAWTFADSTEHNVSSLASAFGQSGNRLIGRFEHTFDEPREYPYACSIHLTMSGYTIKVLP